MAKELANECEELFSLEFDKIVYICLDLSLIQSLGPKKVMMRQLRFTRYMRDTIMND